jgi:GTP-binding protein Era
MRFGNVALVGRTNVGKSTFLNAALGEPLAITSPLPQTTRDLLLGVVHLADAQIAFIDTPGLHRPRHELGRRMNAAALDAARSADLAILMTDTHLLESRDALLPAGARRDESDGIPGADREALDLVPPGVPTILVVNKIDKLKQKHLLLPTITAFTEARDFVAVVPTCMRRLDDVERVLREVATHLPEGPAGYDDDTLTNRPMQFFVREYVREQVMLQTGREIPHAVAVSVDEMNDRGDLTLIKATVHVEKPGQRKIVVGNGGHQIRDIGRAARERIEQLLNKRVYLELFVRVTPRWKNIPRQLNELGYDPTIGTPKA